eukprot:5192206-Amphidinium_carterae.1
MSGPTASKSRGSPSLWAPPGPAGRGAWRPGCPLANRGKLTPRFSVLLSAVERKNAPSFTKSLTSYPRLIIFNNEEMQ